MAYHLLTGETLAIEAPAAPGVKNFHGGFSEFKVFSTVRLQVNAHTIQVGDWQVDTVFLNEVQNADGSEFVRNGHALPESCIESAEHVVRCKHLGGFVAWDPNRSNAAVPPPPQVLAQFGDKTVNISTDPLEAHVPYAHFIQHRDVGVADGVILAYNAAGRPDGVWSCHAGAVVARHANTSSMVIIDVFANDGNAVVPTINTWTMSYLTSPGAFTAHYSGAFGGNPALGRLYAV